MKLLKFVFLFLTVVSVVSCTAQRSAKTGAWHLVATKSVDYAIDRDIIPFDNVTDDFRQLKFKVTNAALNIFDVKVFFDNGDVQDVAVRKVFRKNTESRVIDLTGGVRHLSKIEFWYRTKGLQGKANVEVWGK